MPGKNTKIILGRPTRICIHSAKYANLDKIYVSTDSDEIAQIGKNYLAVHIERPAKLATPESLTEDVLIHAYESIIRDLGHKNIKTISLLFCNNPAINVNLLKDAISFRK